ncbi:MAG: sugar kinase [Pseudomonadota bacterium]
MLTFRNHKVVAIGEAMLELAPVGEGLYSRGYAGDTFNTVWHMAQLLGDRAQVGYVTRVGQDKLSDGFIAELAADGLDTTGIARDPDRTMGLYLIALEGVERSFHYWRSESAARALADDRAVLARAVQDAGLIHLSGITLAILSPSARKTLLNVLADARANRAVISFDPNIRLRLWSSPDAARAAVASMLAHTDIALPSFDDEASLWDDANLAATVARYAAAGVQEVVVKNGPGDVVSQADGVGNTVATPTVTGIRDTTGAGDAFNAGYLSARLLGYSPAKAIAAGQTLSAEVLRHAGARAPKALVRGMSQILA